MPPALEPLPPVIRRFRYVTVMLAWIGTGLDERTEKSSVASGSRDTVKPLPSIVTLVVIVATTG